MINLGVIRVAATKAYPQGADSAGNWEDPKSAIRRKAAWQAEEAIIMPSGLQLMCQISK